MASWRACDWMAASRRGVSVVTMLLTAPLVVGAIGLILYVAFVNFRAFRDARRKGG